MVSTALALEASVRAYSRTFPASFERASGAAVWSRDGRRYLDFFAGAGALNLGHNHPRLKTRLLRYIEDDGVAQALDMATVAREKFLLALRDYFLWPRGLKYLVAITAPTGSDAIEFALKLARRAKGRREVYAFSGSYHGMTLGALSVTAKGSARAAAGTDLNHVSFMPFPCSTQEADQVLSRLDEVLRDPAAGTPRPSAILIEAVQAEGGVNLPPPGFLSALQERCRLHDICLIADEIQVGCRRTGPFCAFESEGVTPDIIVLSKSLSGYGLPLAAVAFAPDLDVLVAGEHAGTFRGNQLAFVTAAEALQMYEDGLEATYEGAARCIEHECRKIADDLPLVTVRGRGMMWGVDLAGQGPSVAVAAQRACFERGLLVETVGRDDTVIKLLPPLITTEDEISEGMSILASAIASSLG